MIPKFFFENQFIKWQTNGYKMIDFTRKNIDLTKLPGFYQKQYLNIGRRIERNYFLNHLLYHQLASYEQINDTFVFEPLILETYLKGQAATYEEQFSI